jgi:hypothetical protein
MITLMKSSLDPQITLKHLIIELIASLNLVNMLRQSEITQKLFNLTQRIFMPYIIEVYHMKDLVSTRRQ